eukprot:6240551-Pyramimonas_sp.AAC.1
MPAGGKYLRVPPNCSTPDAFSNATRSSVWGGQGLPRARCWASRKRGYKRCKESILEAHFLCRSNPLRSMMVWRFVELPWSSRNSASMRALGLTHLCSLPALCWRDDCARDWNS